MFVKFPQAGKVKTRLGKEIGMEKAANFYRSFVEKLAREHSYEDYELVVYFTGGSVKEFADWIDGAVLLEQPPGDLGTKLRFVYETLIQAYESIIVIGSDVPDLTRKDVHMAFEALHDNDVVIGPATDGGYYLLGMKDYYDLFSDISWSTDVVFEQTMKHVKKYNLLCEILDERNDIDTKDDLDTYLNNSNT